MSNVSPSGQPEQSEALHQVSQLVEEVTTSFPISQLVVPLPDTLDWLLDTESTDDGWQRERQALRPRFGYRWQVVSTRALSSTPRVVSDGALHSADYDPLAGSQPWGGELTGALRAALAEIGPAGGEAAGVFPATEHMRSHARAVRMQAGKLVMPLLSYSPLLESEWQAILDHLDEIVDLALTFEGAVVVWLIGGFYRNVDGRLLLKPQVSLAPPQPGTRVKSLHVLLGTAYEEQCPSLIPLARAARNVASRPCASLFRQTDWHRVVVQLDLAGDDYELLNLTRLGENEREMARQVMYLAQTPRAGQVLSGTVREVPRPWKYGEPLPVVPPHPAAPDTNVLPPRPAVEAAVQPLTVPPSTPPSAVANLQRDAEDLRRKGIALADTDPALAQKYLLASTVLENTSVDVWLKLVDLATTPKQKEAFRREAERALKRQHQSPQG